MPSNGFTSRRFHFPRPIVCKPSNPNDCPKGQIVLENLGPLFLTDWTLPIGVQLFITEGEPDTSYQVKLTASTGLASDDGPYDPTRPYSTSVTQLDGGDLVTVAITLTDSNGCRYLGVLFAVIPPNPV